MCVGPGIANGATAIPMWLVLGDHTLGAGWQYLAAAATLALALMTSNVNETGTSAMVSATGRRRRCRECWRTE
jgi:hypothetical protein